MAKILFVSPISTHPVSQGCRVRLLNFAKEAAEAGHIPHLCYAPLNRGEGADIAEMRLFWGDRLHEFKGLAHFAPPPNSQRSNPFRRVAGRVRRWGRRLLTRLRRPATFSVDTWYPTGLNDFLTALHSRHQFDTVVAEYLFFSQALTQFGESVRRVLDTHDAFSLRTQLFHRHGYGSQTGFTTDRHEEQKGLDRADVVIAIQDEEANYFRQLTKKQVMRVGHLLKTDPPHPEPENTVVMAVGGPTAINVDGIRWFCTKVLPRIREQIPKAELWIAGDVCEAFPIAPCGSRLLGRVQNLSEFYRQAAVVINPVRVGSGLSIRSVEALAAGRPLVTTSAGARGLARGNGGGYLTADDRSAFAAAVIKLLIDPVSRKTEAAAARAYAERMNRENLERFHEAIAKQAARADRT
jgi:glycosyltransferase involved in cell wall biosynthesis